MDEYTASRALYELHAAAVALLSLRVGGDDLSGHAVLLAEYRNPRFPGVLYANVAAYRGELLPSSAVEAKVRDSRGERRRTWADYSRSAITACAAPESGTRATSISAAT